MWNVVPPLQLVSLAIMFFEGWDVALGGCGCTDPYGLWLRVTFDETHSLNFKQRLVVLPVFSRLG